MSDSTYIKVDNFCELYSLQRTVFNTFQSYELVKVHRFNSEEYLDEKQYRKAKLIINLYRDLGINPEGIDVIQNLLKRIKRQQKEIISLQNKLRIFDR